jgi:hypothetical protein
VPLTKWTKGRFLKIKTPRAQQKEGFTVTLEEKFDVIE